MSANIASEQLTVSSTAVSLTAATYSAPVPQHGQVTGALVYVATNPICYTCTGVAATTASMPVAAGSYIELTGEHDVENFSAIRSGSADATITVLYFYGA